MTKQKDKASDQPDHEDAMTPSIKPVEPPKEIGGRGGLEPTRYKDWEIGGKCVDF